MRTSRAPTATSQDTLFPRATLSSNVGMRYVHWHTYWYRTVVSCVHTTHAHALSRSSVTKAMTHHLYSILFAHCPHRTHHCCSPHGAHEPRRHFTPTQPHSAATHAHPRQPAHSPVLSGPAMSKKKPRGGGKRNQTVPLHMLVVTRARGATRERAHPCFLAPNVSFLFGCLPGGRGEGGAV